MLPRTVGTPSPCTGTAVHRCQGRGVRAGRTGDEPDMSDEFDPACTPPPGLVLPVRIDASGRTGPTRGQVRSRAWVSTGSGHHRTADAVASVEQRILDVAVRLGPAGAVTGWAALRLLGAAFFDGLARGGLTPLPVPLRTPDRHLRPGSGVSVVRGAVAPGATSVAGVAVVAAEQALLDHVRTEQVDRELVVALDMAFAAGLTSVRRLAAFVDTRTGARGVRRLRRALALAHEQSRSPGEPRLRLIWVLDAGRPLPLANRPVFDLAGNHLGTPDLLDPDAGVVGEYNGSIHRRAAAARRDAERDDLFRRHGLEAFSVVGSDVHDVPRVVERIEATYARATWVPAAERLWTLTPPPGWAAPPSLDERLDHADWLRERHWLDD